MVALVVMVLVLEMGVVLVEVMVGVLVWWFLRVIAADTEITTRATPRQKTSVQPFLVVALVVMVLVLEMGVVLVEVMVGVLV